MPKEAGIGPESWFEPRLALLSLVSRPSDAGIWPVNLFPERSMTSRFLS